MNRLAPLLFLLCACGTANSGAPSATGSTTTTTTTTSTTTTSTPSSTPSSAVAAIGQPAPDFALPSVDGKTVSLKDYAGKVVVLEWFNPGCPFVKYAYGEGPMKSTVASATGKGAVWLAINSGAPGKEGAGMEASREAVKTWGMTQPVLLDESGEVGQKYGAKTTPHMYVIDAAGKLAYMGALDNAPLGKADGAPQGYVTSAVDALLAGKPVAMASTKSYGCSVKYGK